MEPTPLDAALPPDFDHSTRRLVDRMLPAWVTPNGITVARIALVPVVVAAVVTNRFVLALICFLVAVVSDAFDGPLARVRGQVSSLGKILDPLADKVIVLVPFWAWWAATRHDTGIAYTVLVLGGILTIVECWLLTMRFMQMARGTPPAPANLAGKTKVWFEGWMVGFLLLDPHEELTRVLALAVGFIALLLAGMSSYLHRRA